MNTLALIAAPVVSAFAAWFFARKKNNAEAESSELDNTAKAIKIWRELNEDLKRTLQADIDRLRDENCELKKQVTQVMEENESLRKKMRSLEAENKQLIKQLKIFNENNQTP